MHDPRRRRRGIPSAVLTASLAVAVAAPFAASMFVQPGPVPVERILPNLAARAQENPDDANAHYVLGRVHALAFALDTRIVFEFAHQAKDMPSRLALATTQEKMLATLREHPDLYEGAYTASLEQALEDEETVEHARLALVHLARAVELAPADPHHQLGLAYVSEHAAPLARSFDQAIVFGPFDELPAVDEIDEARSRLLAEPEVAPVDPSREPPPTARDTWTPPIAVLNELRGTDDEALRARVARRLDRAWRAKALEHYVVAFEARAREDAATESFNAGRPGGRWNFVSYEAAHAILRLTADQPESRERDDLREAAAEQIAAIDAIPRPNWVTPIVFRSVGSADVPSASGSSSLDALLSGRTARFDLDGDGVAEEWPWFAPDTAILVWDPSGKGAITSGRQLFGSVTWWLFFADGYAAMDALDDDRDGWLTGAELAGLALWHDRDGDGTSDAGEVTPIERTAVRALATRATGMSGPSPMNDRGLRLADGSLHPTFDFVTLPAPQP